MPQKTSKKGCLAAAIVWIVIVGALAVATKFYVLPYFKADLENETGSARRYEHELAVAADSFSGYCVLRSGAFKNSLASQGIKLTVQDDGADYMGRMKSLRSGKVQLAVFTIDSFVLTGAQLGEFPASIILVIDETQGADALVAYKEAVGSIEDLDSAEARIVLTPRSPSEFLSRTIIAHFNLPSLPERWWIEADGAENVYREFRKAKGPAPRAYALWEPYVSKALELPDAHLLLDSSKLKGYIVDVLVAERKFLRDHPEQVRAVVEAYLRAAYAQGRKTNGMRQLVLSDADTPGAEPLTDEQAERLVKGIEWKNTLENYAYFGLVPAQGADGAQHIEDVILNITDVLVKTHAIDDSPFGQDAHALFYDQTLRDLQASGFHPAKKLNVIEGMGPGENELDAIRSKAELAPLSEAQWEQLIPVGRMRVEPISFARGSTRLHVQSERNLDELARKLASWPQYYLVVVGHARAEGDADANLDLARGRAAAAAHRLMAAGVSKTRIKVQAAPPSQKGGEAQSVSFVLGQRPY